MKKYIIIAGVPRAGKSTVSQMKAKQMGYQHISMDSVIAGFEKVLRYISKCDMKTKIVFIHIPFLKNISDTSSFFRKIIDTIETFLLQWSIHLLIIWLSRGQLLRH